MRKIIETAKKQGQYVMTSARNSRTDLAVAAGGGSFALAASSQAAVPMEITDAITAIGVDALAVVTAGIVAWTAFKGLMMVWRVARRVIGISVSG